MKFNFDNCLVLGVVSDTVISSKSSLFSIFSIFTFPSNSFPVSVGAMTSTSTVTGPSSVDRSLPLDGENGLNAILVHLTKTLKFSLTHNTKKRLKKRFELLDRILLENIKSENIEAIKYFLKEVNSNLKQYYFKWFINKGIISPLEQTNRISVHEALEIIGTTA